MSTIFIDSDVLLDVILDRTIHYKFSSQILLLADRSGYYCCTSVHTVLNVHYVTKKYLGIEDADEAIELLVDKLHILTEDANIVKLAMASNFSDFEDAVQYYTAKNANADIIITRNIKDYKQSDIPVLTPEQFLKKL